MKNAIVFFLLISQYGCALGATPCVISWKGSFEQASKMGLRFSIKKHEGEGACFLQGKAFVASASDAEPVSCDVSLYEGARLADGWRIRIIADPQSFEPIKQNVKIDGLMFRINAKAGVTFSFVPTAVELTGSKSCVKWTDALVVE